MRTLALLLLVSCAPTPWLVNYTKCTPHPGLDIADEDGAYRLVRESDPNAPCARALYEGNSCTLEYERCTCGGLWLQRSKVCRDDGQTTEAVDDTVCYEEKIMQGTLVYDPANPLFRTMTTAPHISGYITLEAYYE